MTRRDPRYEWMTLDEFEEMLPDKPSDERWELIGGRVVRMMVGARWEHHRVIANLDYALTDHFRRRGLPCLSYRETFWLKERRQDLAVFPDVMVRCGGSLAGETSLSDPSVVVEVVSKGSAGRDRLEKRSQYMQLPTIQHIVMIGWEPVDVDLSTRLEDRWTSVTLTEPNDCLVLPSIDFSLSLRDLFRDVHEW